MGNHTDSLYLMPCLNFEENSIINFNSSSHGLGVVNLSKKKKKVLGVANALKHL